MISANVRSVSRPAARGGAPRWHTLTAAAIGLLLAAGTAGTAGAQGSTTATTKSVDARPLRAATKLPIAAGRQASAVPRVSARLRAHPKQKGVKQARIVNPQATGYAATRQAMIPDPPLPAIAPRPKPR